MKRFWNEDGSVLVEGIVSLVIISILSLMVFSCLSLSDSMMDRSRRLQEQLYRAKVQVEWEEIPEFTREKEIRFAIDGEEVAVMKGMEYVYEKEEPHLVVIHPYYKERDLTVPEE